jgi:hypothetical protein
MSEPTSGRALSHREYVLDRASRIQRMFQSLGESQESRDQFFQDPDSVAKSFQVTLSPEETFAIKSMREVSLSAIQERLVINPVAFFDANCGCSISRMGLIEPE